MKNSKKLWHSLYYILRSAHLFALESLWDALSTVVEQQAEADGNVEVDAQHLSLESGAKAHSSFKISQTLNEGAAWGLWGLAKLHIRQTQEISAHTELNGALRATGLLCGRWLRDVWVFGSLGLWW